MEWEFELDAYTGEYRGVQWWINRHSEGFLEGYIPSPYREDRSTIRSGVHRGVSQFTNKSRLPERVLGFHCGHQGDFRPNQQICSGEDFDAVYRNVQYVTEQLHLLIDEVLREQSLTVVAYPSLDHLPFWKREKFMDEMAPTNAIPCLSGWGFTNPEEAMAFALTV